MNETKATRYQRLKRRTRVVAGVSAAAMLAAIALTPLSRWLTNASLAFAGGLDGASRTAVALVVFVVFVIGLWELASVPALVYAAWRAGRRYGRAAVSPEEALGAHVRATVVIVPAALGAAATVLVSVRLAGAWWWAVSGVVLAVALVAALRSLPGALARLANTRPLTRQPLAGRLAGLVRRSGLAAARIDEWDVSDEAGATALVTGVGRTRRVLVASSLLRDWSDDEVEVVVAHELAHHVHRDLWRTVVFDIGILWTALGLSDAVVRGLGGHLGLLGPGDLAALPLIALVGSGVWTVATPIRHAQSRRHERRADAFALDMTDGVEAFRTALRRLGARLLAEERPSPMTRWLHHSHPSVAERLALADAHRRTRRGA